MEELLPHHVTGWLWRVANKFSDFYRDCTCVPAARSRAGSRGGGPAAVVSVDRSRRRRSVLGSQQQNSRLLLAVATARAMRQGLALLGITAVDKL